jgi:hypothetical protein
VDETDKGRVLLVDEVVPAEEPSGAEAPPASGAVHDENANGWAPARAGNGAGRGESGAGRAEGAERHAHTCRIRIRSETEASPTDVGSLLGAVRSACAAHPGRTPLFLHLLLPEQEIVVKAGAAPVEASPALTAKLEEILGGGSVLVEYARRA